MLPGLAYDLATIAGIVFAYLDGTVSYRQLATLALGLEPPAAATTYTLAVPHSPAPATCFRLLARFAAGARLWWIVAAVGLQARGEYIPQPAPAHIAPKGRCQTKRETLRHAWQAVAAFRLLADRLGVAVSRWAFVMQRVPMPPAGIDRTSWFVRPPTPP